MRAELTQSGFARAKKPLELGLELWYVGTEEESNRDMVRLSVPRRVQEKYKNLVSTKQSGDNCFLFGNTNGSAPIFACGAESPISGCEKRRIFEVNL